MDSLREAVADTIVEAMNSSRRYTSIAAGVAVRLTERASKVMKFVSCRLGKFGRNILWAKVGGGGLRGWWTVGDGIGADGRKWGATKVSSL